MSASPSSFNPAPAITVEHKDAPLSPLPLQLPEFSSQLQAALQDMFFPTTPTILASIWY